VGHPVTLLPQDWEPLALLARASCHMDPVNWPTTLPSKTRVKGAMGQESRENLMETEIVGRETQALLQLNGN